MKWKDIVRTHLGAFETWATSPAKAIANVRYRIYGRRADAATVMYWTAEAAQ